MSDISKGITGVDLKPPDLGTDKLRVSKLDRLRIKNPFLCRKLSGSPLGKTLSEHKPDRVPDVHFPPQKRQKPRGRGTPWRQTQVENLCK